jgi:hypothetical protein
MVDTVQWKNYIPIDNSHKSQMSFNEDEKKFFISSNQVSNWKRNKIYDYLWYQNDTIYMLTKIYVYLFNSL